MTHLATLILSSGDPRIAAAIGPLVPGVDVLEATDPNALPPLRPGEAWCFVDWVLPEISGLELCRLFRTAPATSAARITMVLDDRDAESRRRALKAGADDYLVGPLSPGLLLDRLERSALVTRRMPPPERLAAGPLELDPSAHRVWFAGRPIAMRPRQFALLSYLMQHPDRVHARGDLLKVLGRKGEEADERTVDAWVARLRRALRHHGAPDVLRTVRDYGYVLDTV
jgi:two-component system phosphate regulon response regulator PhoB